ncbi:uncharacterized protein LOC126988896 isoform X2 [Eriocheir sinensis]|uniref:uncharacterized protein LOC126988896 isoform X2 n=1 Tax=Eriocheir sinensis TaxID=95602 RepID=UPI0021C65C5D|nr:uncharacterized protein LOC126988896 isoform X2 [Eriocheir sinensis]
MHSQEHVAFMFSLQAQREEELQTLQENYKSVYLHPATNVCALLSAGSLLQSGMGDAEALTQVVLPVAFQFNPQLVLVTASLDVGAGTHLEVAA